MKRVVLEPEFAEWRTHARQALQQGYRPEELDLQDATVSTTLALPLAEDEAPTGEPVRSPHTSTAFLALAEVAAVHRDPERWNLLYRVLSRLQTTPALLKIEIDADVARLRQMEQQVRRDLHKMHAFVRFRKVESDAMDEANPFVPHDGALLPHAGASLPHAGASLPHAGASLPHAGASLPHAGALLSQDEALLPQDGALLRSSPADYAGETRAAAVVEQYVAWYRPDHRILRLAAPFFAERFAVMRWSVLTPEESVRWDPVLRQLQFGPGLPREAAPSDDELEGLWRTYYSSIFNPARLNPGVMRQEMPVRYWKDLPEVAMLPQLITESKGRVGAMVQVQATKTSAAPFVPKEHTLPLIDAALPSCEGCELYKFATQAVRGEGPSVEAREHRPRLMLVGEQPGDQEDVKGRPFVGPAGRVLDKAFDELGIDRGGIYLTNAVKHFKFVQRGKLRLHQNPRMSEITACRPWLLAEIDAVRPQVILCLGASAAKSLLGGTFGLMRDHGKILSTPYADQVVATIHPSAVLRARDQQSGDQLFGFLKDDLALAWQTATQEPEKREPSKAAL